MPISENLLGTVGNFTKWQNGGDIKATENGITSSSSNSYAKSSSQLNVSNTYQKI